MKNVINAENAPSAIGPYSHGTTYGDLIFTSGQLPVCKVKGGVVEGGVAEQSKQSLENLNHVLLAGGGSFRRACARRDGHACRRAEVTKRSRYPSAELVPFALETGGRLGADARAFLARCAQASLEPGHEISYLYRAVSSVLQDGVARMLQSASSAG